ncbi:MAG: BTAD domain-containing putative transcriptional regulator [Ardenticatenaceae bacterium]|nr:BTAD domain-containing putative transcriptional regulator [Ardenticatenaceae bacterium]
MHTKKTNTRARFLGAVEFIHKGDRYPLRLKKGIALVVYLASNPKRHNREKIATLLWPDHDQKRAFSNLRRTLYKLNRTPFGSWIQSEADWLLLNPEMKEFIDICQFNDFLERNFLENAVGLYDGPFLSGFHIPDSVDYEVWATTERERFRRQTLDSLSILTANALADGNIQFAQQYAMNQIEIDPLRESGVRELMIAYSMDGKRQEAIAQFNQLKQRLHQELGVEPSQETRMVWEDLSNDRLRSINPALTQNLPDLEAPDEERKVILPSEKTRFIGRIELLHQLEAILADPVVQLITIIGVGGVGKTRLAVQAARHQKESFKDGIFFVPLESLSSPNQIATTVANILGLNLSNFDQQEPVEDRLLKYLEYQEVLLIFDNFEHLLGTSQTDHFSLLSTVLSKAPKSKIIVTSRDRLNLSQEFIFPIEGLRYPNLRDKMELSDAINQPEKYDGLSLFLDCVRRIRPEIEFKSDQLETIATICNLIDGLPLAIKLAAAWVAILSFSEIQNEIETSLDILETRELDIPTRQQSIRAVFEYTWQMLTEEESDSLARLSILGDAPEGFNRASAERIANATLPILLSLSHKSIITRGLNGKFHIHPLIRHYSADRLLTNKNKWTDTKNKHSEFFIEFLQDQSKRMTGREQLLAWRTVDNERANIWHALEWAIQASNLQLIEKSLTPLYLFYSGETILPQDTALLLKIYAFIHENEDASPWLTICAQVLLYYFPEHHGHAPSIFNLIGESLNLISQVEENPNMALWLALLGRVQFFMVSKDQGLQLLWKAYKQVHSAGKPWEIARVNLFLCYSLIASEEMQVAQEILNETVVINEELQDERSLYWVMDALMQIPLRQRNYDSALHIANQALARANQSQDLRGKSFLLKQIADIYRRSGQYDKSAEYYARVARQYEENNNYVEQQVMLGWQSTALTRFGNYDGALSVEKQRQVKFKEKGKPEDLIHVTVKMANIYRVKGDLALAKQLYHKSKNTISKIEEADAYREIKENIHWGLAEIAIQEKDFDEAQHHFEQMVESPFPSTANYFAVYSLSGLGRIAVERRELQAAEAYLNKALDIALNQITNDLGFLLLPFIGFALLASAHKKFDEAIKITEILLMNNGAWHEFRDSLKQIQNFSIKNVSSNIVNQARSIADSQTLEDLISDYL